MSNGFQRRGSIFTGLLLIVLGVIFLIDIYEPGLRVGHWIRLYWPVLIILWGLAKLVDHFAAQRAGGPRGPFLSGGEAVLLIVLAFVLAGFAFRDWLRDRYPDFDIDIPPFQHSYSKTQDLPPQQLPAGAHVIIEIDRGDISIKPSNDNQLRVGVSESAYGKTESDANQKLHNIDIEIRQNGNVYRVGPRSGGSQAGGSTDLDITIPRTVSLDARTNHGDVEIAGVSGPVTAHSGNGDVDVHDIGSDVAVDLQKGDAKITAVAGNVKLTGRGDDVDISDISGDAAIEGAFIGSLHASKIGKTLHCASPWAELTIAQLSGNADADSGDIEISGASGPAKLVTHNKDIDVSNVSGRIDIANTHGDVKVSYSTPPRDDLNVSNDAGDAEVSLPPSSNFQVSAISRSGEAKSDFGAATLKASNENDQGQISGRVGEGGPSITIATSYGTIHLRKAG